LIFLIKSIKMQRRKFVQSSGMLAVGTLAITNSVLAGIVNDIGGVQKKRVAVVGLGIRFSRMWGDPVLAEYGDILEFVALCDTNQGRLSFTQKQLKLKCPLYADFDQMMKEVRPDILIVTSPDYIHHEHIIKGMEYGADIVTEKPMTIDEVKCQAILDTEKKTGKKITVTFNYRYSPHRQKIYELLRDEYIGEITSVDFNYYLDVYHGADYFRRWHRLRENSGTLLVHKSTHHFDLLNWWLNTEPTEVFAYGKLNTYGKNGKFRHTHCRTCPHQLNCKFYFDISKEKDLLELYVEHEKHDGYLRDGCVYREDINIYDQMAVQIKYANNVHASYSLTAYAPFEGYRIAFNGTTGRIEAWIKETQPWHEEPYDEIILTNNFEGREIFKIANNQAGHGGGDVRLRANVFNPGKTDRYSQSAGSRDGAFSILTGIAARKSIDTGMPVKIESLTSLTPNAQRVKT
jgi:predicted dehydrogenase